MKTGTSVATNQKSRALTNAGACVVCVPVLIPFSTSSHSEWVCVPVSLLLTCAAQWGTNTNCTAHAWGNQPDPYCIQIHGSKNNWKIQERTRKIICIIVHTKKKHHECWGHTSKLRGNGTKCQLWEMEGGQDEWLVLLKNRLHRSFNQLWCSLQPPHLSLLLLLLLLLITKFTQE